VLAGQTTLRQLGACLEQAQVVVAGDTGVLHIAAALRKPVVALYGPTSPAITGPLGDSQRTVVLRHPECCPGIPCLQPEHPGFPGMDAISVEEVYDAACQLLKQHG
jgi:ADP-heptose:LPS heptosyltransferase